MKKNVRRTRSKTFPIVGIGASAGGLEAFRQLLRHLPADTGMGFVFVQHLDPTHTSQLTELLARATKLAVFEARNQMVVEPNRLYVIPPNKNLTIVGRKLKLTPRPPGHAHNMPVDMFLKSLAKECGRAAIGVILSGTAADGAEGIKAIRAEGGITFAQDEKSAKYTGMPHAAVATGCVDFVASVRVMANELMRISRHPYVSHAAAGNIDGLEGAASHDLNPIFHLLRSAARVDFTHYKPTTIRRRIQRRMAVHRQQKLSQYIHHLKTHPEEVEILYEDLLISVTGFFRDAGAFNVVQKKIIPRIISGLRKDESIRIWVPGCATGEEVYTLAILLLERLGDKAGEIPLQIFATDISERALARARAGVFPENIVADVSPPRLKRFFIQVPGGYQISKAVRELCIFARQNVAQDPPFSNLDLVSCRNLLIYLSPLLQKRVMPIFHYALKPNGFLLLGGAETTSGSELLFGPVDQKHRIYVKRASVTRSVINFSHLDHPAREAEAPHKPLARDTTAFDIQREADRLLLGRFAPAAVLINQDMDILQFRGRTGLYLEPASGSASLNLLKMAREGLLRELRTAVHKARRQGVAIRRKGLPLQVDGAAHSVNIEVVPIKSTVLHERHFLVLFEDSNRSARVDADVPRTRLPKGEKAEEAIVRLEQELTATKEHMQSVAEGFEEANEELKAANEEIQSSNEELQSANEELETAKEELQSTNEELTTLNEELQNRNGDLDLLNNDLVNLLTSVNLPILMLGPDLRVRRITPAAEKVLHVRPSDIGRLVTDLRLPIDVPDLERLIAESIDSLSVKTREVQDRGGHWYLLRIRPYRTTDNKIDGAVIKLLDIDPLKRSLQQAEQARDFEEAIVETVREPLLVLDPQLRVLSANQMFYQLFQVDQEQTVGRFVYDLGNKQWNIPALRALLEEVLPQNSHFNDYEMEHEFPVIGRKTMLLNARRVQRPVTEKQMILLAIEDTTERKRLEKAVLDIAESEQQRIGRDLHDGLGQQLAGIGFMLDTLGEQLTARGMPEAVLATKITARIKQAVTQTRDLAKGLFPVELKTHGIITALEKLALNTEQLFRIACHFRANPKLRIADESVSRHLYRIAQEAVFNAVKHSHGKLIHIALTEAKGALTLTVKDNGVGIDQKRVRESDMGLHIMNYRARMIGAKLEIKRGPRGGTMMTCVVENAEGKRGIHEDSKKSDKGNGQAAGSHRR